VLGWGASSDEFQDTHDRLASSDKQHPNSEIFVLFLNYLLITLREYLISYRGFSRCLLFLLSILVHCHEQGMRLWRCSSESFLVVPSRRPAVAGD
jgi:hypothetical protein